MNWSINFASIYEKVIEPYFRTDGNSKLFKVIGSSFQSVIDDMAAHFLPQKVKEANYNSCKLAFEWFLNDKFNNLNDPNLQIFITNNKNQDNSFYIWSSDDLPKQSTFFLEGSQPLLFTDTSLYFDTNYQYGYGDVVILGLPDGTVEGMFQCINDQPYGIYDLNSWRPVEYTYSGSSDINSVIDFIVFVPIEIMSNKESEIKKFINDIKLYNMYNNVFGYEL